MYKLDGRWAKFKQELVPIIYVSVVQIWWSFNIQAIRLEAPWNTALAVINCIVGIICTVFMFSFADTFAPRFNLNYLYVLAYIGCLITFISLYRAIHRVPSVKETV